tara:strand:+ start:4964 stop:5761 length:798 start_codon:yes stop_codon:yes gene_type:complete
MGIDELMLQVESYQKQTNIIRHHGDSRWYTRRSKLDWKPSVTSVIGGAVDKGKGFEMWLGNQPSYDAACTVRNKAAKRGTLVHEYCEALTKGSDADLRDDKHIIEEEGCDIDEIAKYMMSFDLWRHESNSKVLVSEIMLYHDDIPWSGTFDMVTQNDKLAMVDIKTGEHYKAHDIQLNMYRILWNKIFPDFKIETIQGLYLKGKWIKQPNYKLANVKIDEDICWKVYDLWTFLNTSGNRKPWPKDKYALEYAFEANIENELSAQL